MDTHWRVAYLIVICLELELIRRLFEGGRLSEALLRKTVELMDYRLKIYLSRFLCKRMTYRVYMH